MPVLRQRGRLAALGVSFRVGGRRWAHRCRLLDPSAVSANATYAHEAIHSTGHASRLHRDLEGRLGCPRYAREELIAELGSVLLGQRLEIGCDLVNHAAYLAHWAQLLKESPRVLFQVLSAARQAADLIAPEPAAPGPDLRFAT